MNFLRGVPTRNQLALDCREVKKRYRRRKLLKACPQRRAVCIKTRIMAPKKPNSAERKVVRVAFFDQKRVTVAIPGEGHNLQQFSVVLIRGCRVRDLPGVQYKVIRGTADAIGVPNRKQRRSKFGTRRTGR